MPTPEPRRMQEHTRVHCTIIPITQLIDGILIPDSAARVALRAKERIRLYYYMHVDICMSLS
jgi:hypothetical protein